MSKPKIRIMRGPGHFVLRANNIEAVRLLGDHTRDQKSTVLSRKDKDFYLNLIGWENRREAIAMLATIRSWYPIYSEPNWHPGYYEELGVGPALKSMYLEFIKHYTTDTFSDSKILLIDLSPVHMQGFVTKAEAIQIIKTRAGRLLEEYSIHYGDKVITIFQSGD